MQNNPVKKLIEIVGSQTELARRCRIRQQNVSKWLKKGVVPLGRITDAIKACNGQMTPEELCPKIKHLIKFSQTTGKTITTKP